MDIFQRLNSLQLNNNFAFDDKIKSMLADLMIPIKQWDRLLPHKCNSANGKLHGEGLLAHRFQKTWPKLGVHSYRRCDD